MNGFVSSLQNTKNKKYRHQIKENQYIIRLILLSPLLFYPSPNVYEDSRCITSIKRVLTFRMCVATAAAVANYLKCHTFYKVL